MGHGFHGYLKLPQGIKPGDSDKMRNYGKTMGYNQQQLRDIIGYRNWNLWNKEVSPSNRGDCCNLGRPLVVRQYEFDF